MEYYNMDGTEFKGDTVAWGKEFEKIDRKIALDKLPNGKIVSTVFLSIDHNFSGQGKPLLFETMVFPNDKDMGDLDCDRYPTKEDALVGHKKMVEKWQEQ